MIVAFLVGVFLVVAVAWFCGHYGIGEEYLRLFFLRLPLNETLRANLLTFFLKTPLAEHMAFSSHEIEQ